jgi:hypothetical protein
MANETFEFKVTPTNKGGVPDLADDLYDFTISEIKKAEGGDPKYDKGVPRAEFVYALDQVDEAGDAIVVRDWITVYPKPAPKSKLYRLISAALYGGKELPENGGVSASQLLGTRARLLWGTKEMGDGKGVIGYLPAKG